MGRSVFWSFGGAAVACDLVALDGASLAQWSAVRASGQACTVLTPTPSLPSLEERALALPARVGEFDHLLTDDAQAFACAQRLGMPVQRVSSTASKVSVPECTRALVVTRAQPLHRGHLALIDRGLQLADEVIVVIAAAERSHTARDPFTAGERLQMVLAALGERARRCWLLALPSPTWAASALRELALYAPPYQLVVANNPVLIEMAEALRKRVVVPELVRVDGERLSASRIRERLLEGAGTWLHDFVPEGCVEVLASLAPRCARIASA